MQQMLNLYDQFCPVTLGQFQGRINFKYQEIRCVHHIICTGQSSPMSGYHPKTKSRKISPGLIQISTRIKIPIGTNQAALRCRGSNLGISCMCNQKIHLMPLLRPRFGHQKVVFQHTRHGSAIIQAVMNNQNLHIQNGNQSAAFDMN